ncbi:MAG TPA: AraC family transcriptional regulator [Dinghuibacter sp.]|uniref:AraC family transcriptional regulator n=1 Tax=Dinghuibacter sp. TaxID=2024697 RepID=UPI002BE16924|nr:AraC family transcriptional regulator [Dinghuibacter sp.]HTJ13259.1 AraC family transcriptional regulator [Dinghuibacter sp.]
MLVKDIHIPTVSFRPDPEARNPWFRVNRVDRVVHYLQKEFLAPHRKDYYFLALVREGCSRHWVDMVPYELLPNRVYFTIPQQVHLKEEAKPMTGTVIGFSEDFLSLEENGFLRGLPLIRNPHNGHELRLSDGDVAFMEDITDKIIAEYRSRQSWQQGMLSAYVRVLLIFLSRLYTEQFSSLEPSSERLLLKRFLACIDQHYIERHEVAAYAELLHISAGHLGDVVREQSGKPAITHIHERLVMEARRLLFHSERAVKEIAFELGFEDASYFNRFFKRLTGQTPAIYRATIREMYH